MQPNLLKTVLFMMLLVGCNADSSSDMRAVDSQQRGILFIKASFPFELVLDKAGNQLEMPDGLEVIIESPTFDREIISRLSDGSSALDLTTVVRVDATFRLRKQNVVVGVDADGNEFSNPYHLVEFDQIFSVDWCPNVVQSRSVRRLN